MPNLPQITENDIVQNNASQLMVCILIDASYSMIHNRRIEMVNEGIKEFIKFGKNDIYARDFLDVCFITFGGDKPKIIQEFSNIQFVNFCDIKPAGGTKLNEAVKFAIKRIQRRKQFWESVGTDHAFTPWLIIISDGKSDDNVNESARLVQDLYHNDELKGKCIGVGDGSETQDLTKLAPYGHVESMDAIQIKDFFKWLSKSVKALSTSTPEAEDDSYEINI